MACNVRMEGNSAVVTDIRSSIFCKDTVVLQVILLSITMLK